MKVSPPSAEGKNKHGQYIHVKSRTPHISRGRLVQRRCLKVNEPKDKEEVARRKVFDFHFTGDVTANHPLPRTSEMIIPHVMSWFGRDNLCFSAVFIAVQFFSSKRRMRTHLEVFWLLVLDVPDDRL
jgi:hypothetical protein